MQKQSESVDNLLVSVVSLSSAAIDVSAGDLSNSIKTEIIKSNVWC